MLLLFPAVGQRRSASSGDGRSVILRLHRQVRQFAFYHSVCPSVQRIAAETGPVDVFTDSIVRHLVVLCWPDRNGFDWESFTVHDHYIWNSARPRTEQRTVEMRPACQQPWDEHMVVSALCLGLVEASTTILQVALCTMAMGLRGVFGVAIAVYVLATHSVRPVCIVPWLSGGCTSTHSYDDAEVVHWTPYLVVALA